jgi:HEAT repeat protein
MNASFELAALVAQMPDPDKRGMYTEDIDKPSIDKAVAAICEGGKESLAALVAMLDEPGSEANVKPRYALRCVVNQALIDRNDRARGDVTEVLANELGKDRSTYVKTILCQELQWAGTAAAAPALGRLLLDESLTEPAAMALVAIGNGAVEQFRSALPKASGRCRLQVIQGLGALADRGSLESLRESTKDSDLEIRLAAGWALARAGDADSLPMLVSMADEATGWERIQATKHCLLLAEALSASGKQEQAARIYRHLRDTRTDPEEQYIHDVAEKALSNA